MSPDGSRVAVLDLILEVPTKLIPPLSQERRVLGFDWGVRSLITASVVEQRPGKTRYPQVSRPVFLDTGGIDGRQARLRREIDRLKAFREHYAALCTEARVAHAEQQKPLSADLARWQARVRAYEERIGACWQKYARRNRELAHLAANLLILLALLSDCYFICGENLATLRTEGRGRGVRGRWRHWRNNTTVRGELWRVLSYKCSLLGIRVRQVEPRGTTHTCPHCHQPARTFASPADRKKALDWGPWLCCENPECLWNGARLRRQPEYRPARPGPVPHRSPEQTVQVFHPDCVESQASLVQQDWRDAAGAVAGDHTPPQRGHTRLLCRLVLFPGAPDVSSHQARCGAVYVAPAQARPRAVCHAGIDTWCCNGILRPLQE